MPDVTRAFIAIEIESSIQLQFKQIQENLKKIDVHVSWVKPENIHLTLKFLGDVKNKKLKSIIEAFPSFFNHSASFSVKIEQLGGFPNMKNPRTLWAGISGYSEKLSKLSECVEMELTHFGFKKEKKVFTPHMTLGRVRGTKNIHQLTNALRDLKISPPLSQEIKNVTLFESILSPQGSIYDALATHTLKS